MENNNPAMNTNHIDKSAFFKNTIGWMNSHPEYRIDARDDTYEKSFDNVNKKLDEEIKLIKELSKNSDEGTGLIYTTLGEQQKVFDSYYDAVWEALNKQGKHLHAHIDDTRSNLAQINMRISNQVETMKEIVSFQQSLSNNLHILTSAIGDIREHMKLPWYKRWFKRLKI